MPRDSPDNDDERPRQRRRVNDDSDEDDASLPSSPSNTDRAARIAALARRRRLQNEVLQLAGEDDDYEEIPENVPVDEEVEQALLEGEEEEDGEDLLENAERDYQRIEALDTYGTEGIDDNDYGLIDTEQREAAERELARRDRARGGRSDGFYGMMLETVEDEEDEEARQARRGIFGRGAEGEEEEDEETDEEDLDGEDQVNLEAFDVPLREWIAQDRTRREIQRRFRAFLRHFTPDDDQRRRRGNGIYEQKIRSMCAANLSTLPVSYVHLMDSEPILAYWLADAPKDMLLVLNEAATRHTLMLFPSYTVIKSEIHVRVSDVPILDSLRDLRRSHLDCLVKVHGVVTRRSSVYPQLQLAYYTCGSCKNTQGPFRMDGVGSDMGPMHMPDSCPNCEVAHFRLHPTMSVYRNMQRLNLQETPGSVPPGRVPRTKEVLLTDDLIDIARPGEEVEITGVYEHTFDSINSGFPVFSTFIHANHVSKREDASSASNLSEADVRKILELARDPKIGERIVQSIAPSIFGHDFCKRALAMSLFGGVPKNVNDKHRIRGDVNVLLLGDPGTAKSQLLKYAEHTAPRAVYSTGKGASAVGLTASVHKDPITREWTLEGGALVLADKGVCLIDEFDKMNEQDRTSIHEAMEQQSISISKAGIVTSLQARCSVIAAANPIGGRYDSTNTLADNVELTDPILQRFDILCVLQDTVDPVADERLAQFVTSSHMRSIPTREMAGDDPSVHFPPGEEQTGRQDLIPQDLLRKYIQYARTNVHPVLRGNTFDQEKVASLYVALRRESAASGGVPIAVRHVESIMRMSEAHAKMHLRDYVRDDDMDASIRMMLGSFIDAQKFSVRRALKRSFAKFITSGEDRAHLLLHILQDMFRKEQMYQVIRQRQRNQAEDVQRLDVPLDELEGRARERRIYDVTEFCKSRAFQEAGYFYDEGRGVISRAVV
jgi:DNA replication licensing factor MCM2